MMKFQEVALGLLPAVKMLWQEYAWARRKKQAPGKGLGDKNEGNR